MGPEATFIDGIASGRIPFSAGLLAVLVWIVWKGGIKLDRLTVGVEAVPPALLAHKVENDKRSDTLAAHVTAQADRVVKEINDHRMSEIAEGLEGVKRAASNPDPEQGRRAGDTQRRRAVGG